MKSAFKLGKKEQRIGLLVVALFGNVAFLCVLALCSPALDVTANGLPGEELHSDSGIQGDSLKESLESFVDGQITRSEDLVRFWSAAKEGGESVQESELAMLERHESRLPALWEIKDELAKVDSSDIARLEELRQGVLDLCIEGTDYDASDFASIGG